MSHVKNYNDYINEGHLPFSIERELRINKAEFIFDEDETEDDDDTRFDSVEVYSWRDRNSGANWLGKVAVGGAFYYLEIQKDEEVVFSEKYPKSQRAYFDQDCANSLGFSPEL